LFTAVSRSNSKAVSCLRLLDINFLPILEPMRCLKECSYVFSASESLC
jgi:hypothetical protein